MACHVHSSSASTLQHRPSSDPFCVLLLELFVALMVDDDGRDDMELMSHYSALGANVQVPISCTTPTHGNRVAPLGRLAGWLAGRLAGHA